MKRTKSLNTNATNLLQIPPGTISGGHMNSALLAAFVVFVVLGLLFFFGRGRLIYLKRQKETIHYAFELSEWGLALAISILGTFFEVFKKETWKLAPVGLIGSAALISALITVYLGVKLIGASAKKADSQEIESLKKEKAVLEQTVSDDSGKYSALKEQRDKIIEVTTHVRAIVDNKMKRLITTVNNATTWSPNTLVQALSPQDQLVAIVRTIFVYFQKKTKAGEILRLAIYARNPIDRNELTRVYGWNGQTSECFRTPEKDLGRLDDVSGPKTQIVKLMQQKETIAILESCPELSKIGAFNYFPGQDNYLKSMVLYKHVFDIENGLQDAYIITLDTSQEGLFKKIEEPEIRIFLLEMMKRVEFELRVLETLNKSKWNPSVS